MRCSFDLFGVLGTKYKKIIKKKNNIILMSKVDLMLVLSFHNKMFNYRVPILLIFIVYQLRNILGNNFQMRPKYTIFA